MVLFLLLPQLGIAGESGKNMVKVGLRRGHRRQLGAVAIGVARVVTSNKNRQPSKLEENSVLTRACVC